MTSVLTFANRGRRLIWLGASLHLYNELSDDELTLSDASALGYWTIATTALFIPDPEATLLGYIGSKSAAIVKGAAVRVLATGNAAFGSAARWWGLRSLVQRSAITYVLFTPILLAAAQKEKETLGVEGWDEALGEAMWQAQSDPTGTGEQLNINITSSPMSGSLPF